MAAERAGLDPRQWQKVEDEETNATLETLARVAAALDTTIRELFKHRHWEPAAHPPDLARAQLGHTKKRKTRCGTVRGTKGATSRREDPGVGVGELAREAPTPNRG